MTRTLSFLALALITSACAEPMTDAGEAPEAADALDGDGALDVELCARAAVFALQLHAAAVAAHEPLRRPLVTLKAALRRRLAAETQLYGRNLAGVRIAGLRAEDAAPARPRCAHASAPL